MRVTGRYWGHFAVLRALLGGFGRVAEMLQDKPADDRADDVRQRATDEGAANGD